MDRYEYFCTELRRSGVTRWLLWADYRHSYPGGYCYSHFCKHLQDIGHSRNLTMANLLKSGAVIIAFSILHSQFVTKLLFFPLTDSFSFKQLC